MTYSVFAALYSQYLVQHRPFDPFSGNGDRYRFKFDNGYEASVIRGGGTYGGDFGLYELAVLYDGMIVYDTPITDDVLGWLTDSDVAEQLVAIKNLPPRR